ncbi:type II toxin-antitoxin system VapC family toxin [Roseateles sp.]|jgi:tRNA(fMet)-specific endonuclease VapC|uniref:type II toxin-antitoxin system VapC family toxin n=1 Tax=Roseateles sp. TaxID=1971397 RepID=UPI00391B7C18
MSVRSASLYLLDTNVISHLMRYPLGAAMQRLLQLQGESQAATICTSVLVQYELRYGLQRKSNPRLQQRYEEAMDFITVLPLDGAVATPYATLRTQLEAAGTPIGPHDTLIAAHALSLGATLVSGDAEFARVPGLSLENWLD